MNAPVESKLLPCPHCGGEAKLYHPPSLWEPGSGKADATMAMVVCKAMCREGYQATDAAITAWNTRNQVVELVEIHPILAEIMAEVEKATRKFPTWPTRIIDAGNVVSEEAGELAKACLQVTYEKHKETMDGVRMEAIQTAAMCFRFLVSMDCYDTEPCEQHEQPALASHKGE